ncbi:MAG: CocE/NonD family hydrolase [Drouetiella hepatica Uher 2000/2452]|uniref:CocE/NonD family hydrolase n=1 Tax=Drouetiella hepatica Uher 2000/2452 TaxID=904376 RepID=A0A951UN71_9CYAN|nr:CocE/NonD family hydrolase [Drouetiella hepatica Uher 2000/2452]
MQTRDGVRLDADVYYPDREDEFPVLLMRQPYGRAIASTVVYAHPIWYAAQGYIVVIQDVRGRGSSQGEFELFAHEVEDGFDTVQWAASLPQSNGQVGMYGFSYQGMTQLYAAIAQPSALKVLAPSMVGYDLYHDWAYEGGAFCYQLNLGWAMQLAAETARRKGDAEAYQTLYSAARNPPLHDPVCPQSGILRQLAPDSHYHAWLSHADPSDDYWQISPHFHMQKVDLPMLHIGGWFDPYLRGTMRLYRAMAARSQFPQHLMVAPWAHLPWGRRTGAIDYGANANSAIDRLQIQWFDYFLKGVGALEELPVSLFEMGTNRWRKFKHLPAHPSEAYFLSSTGLSALGDREGSLTPHVPRPTFPDLLIHDPWRPVPSLGGHATLPAGAFDRAALDCRTDILTYTSEPLEADLHIAGESRVQIYCTADTPSFDLCAILSEVKFNSSVFNFTQGYLHIPTSSALPASYLITLQPTCICIPSGSRIRLSISAASFPAYPINPGAEMPAERKLINAQVITVTVYAGGDRPSQLLLAIEESKEPEVPYR